MLIRGYLTNNDFVKYKTYEYSKVKEAVVDVATMLNVVRPAYRTAFFTPPATQSILRSAYIYTQNGHYIDINESMKANNLTTLSFEDYCTAIELMDYLDTCSVKDTTVFRGTRSKRDLKVGEALPNNFFVSTTLSMGMANRFGCTMFKIHVKNAHGAFINDISEYRDKEFEILLNAGYDFVITRVIEPETIYECTLRRNDNKVNRAFDNTTKININFYNSLLQSDIILNNTKIDCDMYDFMDFYVYRLDLIEFDKKVKVNVEWTDKDAGILHVAACYYTKSPDDADEDGEVFFEFSNTDTDESDFMSVIHDVVAKLEEVVTNASGCQELNTSITVNRFKPLFYNLVGSLQQKGYIIKGSSFSTKDESLSTSDCTGKICINGDNDDNLIVTLKLDMSNNLSFNARAASERVNKTLIFDANKIFDLCKEIVATLETSFRLDQSRRVSMAMRLACSYLNIPYVQADKSVNAGCVTLTYSLPDNKALQIVQQSGYIYVADKSFEYSENLRTVASAIVDVVKSMMKG
jgi:hypothetical protein